MRTFLVFLELPIHLEYQALPMPLIPEGTVLDLDLRLENPKDRRRVRTVVGPHTVFRRKLVYVSQGSRKSGLSQYLELKRDPQGPG